MPEADIHQPNPGGALFTGSPDEALRLATEFLAWQNLTIIGTLKDGRAFSVYGPASDQHLKRMAPNER